MAFGHHHVRLVWHHGDSGQQSGRAGLCGLPPLPWMTESFWASLFGIIGGVRIIALYINGRSPRTPYGRMVGAAFGMMSWLQVDILIAQGSWEQLGSIPPGIAVYSAFVYAEARSLWRASYDARYLDH